MPRRDGTGPMGMGPMTGRAMGCCAGYAAPGFVNTGISMKCGKGFRRMYYMTGLPGWARFGAYPYGYGSHAYQGTVRDVDEKEILQKQADFLENQLKEVRKRLKGFEADE